VPGDLLSHDDVGICTTCERGDQGLVAGYVGEDAELLGSVVCLDDPVTFGRPDAISKRDTELGIPVLRDVL